MGIRCLGCGSTRTLAEIKAEHPNAIACCPEREVVCCDCATLRALLEKAEKVIEPFADRAKEYSDDTPNSISAAPLLTIGECRAAASLLSEIRKGTK